MKEKIKKNPELELAMEIEAIANKLNIPIANRQILALNPQHVIVHEAVLVKYRHRLNADMVGIVERQLIAIKEQYETFHLDTLSSIPSQYSCHGIYVFCGGFWGAFSGASITQTILASQREGYNQIYISPTGVLPDSALIR